MRTVFKVRTSEHERGFGERDVEHHYFSSKEKADKFIENYNKSNTLDYAPDTYWRADYCGEVELPSEKEIL